MARMMIMAGGTGGHVFPALAVAEELRQRGWEVDWMGTPESFESRTVPEHGFALHSIPAHRLRGQGVTGLILAPFRLLSAMWAAGRILRVLQPQLVLGMGGFASGPGGLVSRLLGIPLVIHEQNSIPGLTNRWLAKLARRVCQAFPGAFPRRIHALTTGNPVRADICALAPPEQRWQGREGPLRVLVIGGSLGAQALNLALPAAFAQLNAELEIRHQAGRGKQQDTERAYAEAGIEAQVREFIDDMAQAYAWADLLICRAGALTVSEIAAAGLAALLVPFPHAVDDHQTHNAAFLVEAGAARMVQQKDFDQQLLPVLADLLDRDNLLAMAQAARKLRRCGAAAAVADACEQEASA